MFTAVEQTLFESTNAKFALRVNAMLTKDNPTTGSTYKLVTCMPSQKDPSKITARLRPSTYLVFVYMPQTTNGMNPDLKTVWLSNPHMAELKAITGPLKNAILSNNAFVKSDGILSVNDAYNHDFTMTNIGLKQHSLSIRLRSDAMVDNNNNFLPSVEISLSPAPETCILSLTEFLAVAEIIEQVNLPLMAMEIGFAHLIMSQQKYGGAPARAANNSNGYNNSYSGTRRAFSTPTQAQPQPSASTFVPTQQHQNTDAGSAEYYTQTAFQPKAAATHPYTSPAPRQQEAPKTSALPPRSAPLMSNDAVEQTEVDDLDLGDVGISELF